MPVELVTPLKYVLYAAAGLFGVYVWFTASIIILGLFVVSRK